jgi:MoaA/NifB/PqqE/SkfB family radical SAM enzyme
MLPSKSPEPFHLGRDADYAPVPDYEAQCPPPDAPPLCPKSLTVLIDTTNQCNLRCRMCHFSRDEIARRPYKPMSQTAFQRLAREVFPAAHTILLSAAAEPLIHEDFPEFLRIASTYKPRKLAFLTNGQYLTPEMAAHCIDCGLSEIHVSIDGATPETYQWARRCGDFQRLVDNLTQLQSLKRKSRSRLPVVQFNVVLMRKNVTELGEFARLAARLGVDRIACRHLILYAGLGMESESLFADKHWANEQMSRQLEEMSRYEVTLAHFPNLFARPEDPDHPGERNPGYGASTWYRLPHRLRWAVQSARHRLQGRPEGRRPIGAVEFPSSVGFPAAEGIQVSGWALHHHGVERVVIGRKPIPGEIPATTDILGLIEIGEAARKISLRPDLRSSFPGFPGLFEAEWGFVLRKSSLPSAAGTVSLFVVAWGRDGTHSILGKRVLYPEDAKLPPRRPFCRHPFESVYIDSSSNVYPYADCLNCPPFGFLSEESSFSGIWHGKAYRELRRRILEGDPPGMCLACPDFINRRVDDPVQFAPRVIVD